MPDRIELASSGRARCRACRRPIARGQERFAEAVPNPAAEGESQHYYHLECAAERRPKPFAGLLPTLDPPRLDLAALNAAAALTLEHHRLERLGVLERAKSARAACRQCGEPIEKGAWRVALQPIEEGRLAAWGFVHLACAGAYAGIKPGLERLTRYSELEPSERDEVAAALAAMPTPEPRTDEDDNDRAAGADPSAEHPTVTTSISS
jgi:hypothetical protein